MTELIKDRDFLETLAPRLGLKPRTVKKHLAAVAARGHFDGMVSAWTPEQAEECSCDVCQGFGLADE